MLLLILISCPFLGGFICYLSQFYNTKTPRWIALFTTCITFLTTLKILLFNFFNNTNNSIYYPWKIEYYVELLSKYGVHVHFAIDNLTIPMLIITCILGIFSILCNWNSTEKYVGSFYLNILFLLGFTFGVLLSIDLFLFFCFWECLLIPTYFLTVFWGNSSFSIKERIKTANKFLIYSQASSLLMLISILYLVLSNYNASNVLTFDYNILKNTKLNFWSEFFIMLGFFIPFITKMPIVPFHNWLPGLQKTFPTNSSVDLMSVILKISVYGLIRFNITMFPLSSIYWSKYAISLGLLTILYGSIVAFSQKNIKKFIAYSSISHSGIMLIGIYTFNVLSYTGLIIYTISNVISTSAILMLTKILYETTATYNLKKIKISTVFKKWISGLFMFFLLANLGIPGTGNFSGEFLILIGNYIYYPISSIIISLGLILISIYSMYVIYNMYFGKNSTNISVLNTYKRFIFLIFISMLLIIIIGIFPEIISKTLYHQNKIILEHLLSSYLNKNS